MYDLRVNKNMPEAVLWDMDGTIVDTEPHWVNAEKKLLERFGAQFREEDSQDWVGIGLWDLAEIMRERGVAMSPDDIVSTLSNMVDEEFFAQEINWRPGSRTLLKSFTDHKILNALVTMATRAQALKVVERLPENTFKTVTAGDDVAKPKPHPEPYLKGAASLGVAIENCVAIEDSVTGVISAARSGAFVVAVPNLVDLKDAPYDMLVDSLDKITAEHIFEAFKTSRKER